MLLYPMRMGNPCIFKHPNDMMDIVHGDDFVSVGKRKELEEFKRGLERER